MLLKFELDPDEDTPRFSLQVRFATDQAMIVSANVLLVQINELLSAHGDKLHELANEALKTLIRECMSDLEEFAAAREVDFKPRGTLLDPSRKWYPKPWMAIGNGLWPNSCCGPTRASNRRCIPHSARCCGRATPTSARAPT